MKIGSGIGLAGIVLALAGAVATGHEAIVMEHAVTIGFLVFGLVIFG